LKSKKTSRKILIVTHNLNLEGAPLFLFNLAKGLRKIGYKIHILSPTDGPVKEYFTAIGMKTIISDFTSKEFGISRFEEKYDLIIVNTIIGYKFIKKLDLEREKVIWTLHESDRVVYFKQFSDLKVKLFSNVQKVVFSSIATRDIYEDLNTANTFAIVNTVGDWGRINDYIKKNNKDEVKNKYNFKESDFLVNLVGTICLRKGQLEFAEAAINILKESKKSNLKFVMVGGGRGYKYEEVIRKMITLNGLNGQIIIFNETKDVFDFYLISDIFVCNSYIEAFPMVTLEAMAFGLPIVSTDAYGLAEQFEDEKNGMLVMAGDKEGLKDKIMYLIKNRDIAKKLGANAKKKVEEEFSFEKMIDKYDSLISEVCDKNE